MVDILFNILKNIIYIIITVFVMLGIFYVRVVKDIPMNIIYLENNTKIDAIEYHNEIYLKKENDLWQN